MSYPANNLCAPNMFGRLRIYGAYLPYRRGGRMERRCWRPTSAAANGRSTWCSPGRPCSTWNAVATATKAVQFSSTKGRHHGTDRNHED